MATASMPDKSKASPKAVGTFRVTGELAPLRVSSYDRFAGLLMTLLIFIGFIVLTLLIVWITSQDWRRDRIVPIDITEPEPGGGGQGAAMTNLEEPKEDELEVIEPVLEVIFEAITDAITTQVAVLDQMQPKIGRAHV